MIVIPAIDLRDGKCVRLIQGRYDQEITYKDDPVEQARGFAAQGAQWLHVVDLDGAKAGRPVNTTVIKKIAALGTLKVEVGGGIRDQRAIEELLDTGVERVIIGTQAVKDTSWFRTMAQAFPKKLVLGLDARGSSIATHGWLQESSLQLVDFAQQASDLPLSAIIYTDISKDGMLIGPNVERTTALAQAVSIPVIASGGVAVVDHIRQVAQTRLIAGVIVGRSLYEGTVTLPDALVAAQG